jgi:hypothetical protein
MDIGIVCAQAADWAVAGGTGLLAVATFWLGWKTRKVAKHAGESARASREALDAETMPLLTAVDDNITGTDQTVTVEYAGTTYKPYVAHVRPGEVHVEFEVANHHSPICSVPVTNVGRGVALITSIKLALWKVDVIPCEIHDGGEAIPAVLAPRSTGRLRFAQLEVTEAMTTWAKYRGGFSVEVSYTDARGRQPHRTWLDVYSYAGGRWAVRAVRVFRDSENEPFHESIVRTHTLGWIGEGNPPKSPQECKPPAPSPAVRD